MTEKLKNIQAVCSRLGIRPREMELFGRYKAKVDLSILDRIHPRRKAKYILVTAATPTPLGEGKTVTTIGLSMALNRLRRKAACTLRQSSLGPLFGAKGMASGGGACQILPAQDINLHLTGDTHAVGVANNLLVSFVENALFHGSRIDLVPSSLCVKRCLDISDRALRHIRYTLKCSGQKTELNSGFEITAASEVSSILALSRDRADMKRRLSHMAVGRTRSGDLVFAKDVKADGMMAAVLKDAIKPNLVQTSENTPCFVHAGPFANVSVGCSSIVADTIALGLCDYVVTESGFGADCGAEKFFDIKCRMSGYRPDAAVLVCSARALKFQSGRFPEDSGFHPRVDLLAENLEALAQGVTNLKKQIDNVRCFGVPVVVAVNVFPGDHARELEFICAKAVEFGAADSALCTVRKDGAWGGVDLARKVILHAEKHQDRFSLLYEEKASLREKIEAVACRIYGASGVEYSAAASDDLDYFAAKGFGRLPVCIAKTQFSLSHDESLKGAPTGFIFPVRDVRLCSGAGFVLAHASLMQTMPGLPARPRGEAVDMDGQGNVTGLS